MIALFGKSVSAVEYTPQIGNEMENSFKSRLDLNEFSISLPWSYGKKDLMTVFKHR
jgi:hypothetical protein